MTSLQAQEDMLLSHKSNNNTGDEEKEAGELAPRFQLRAFVISLWSADLWQTSVQASVLLFICVRLLPQRFISVTFIPLLLCILSSPPVNGEYIYIV